jgi:hypothetical protein
MRLSTGRPFSRREGKAPRRVDDELVFREDSYVQDVLTGLRIAMQV